MSEREQLPDITRLPFPLPLAFLERFGYPYDRRLVGVYWERAGDDVAFDDGVHAATGLADHYVYWELTRQPQVQAWLWDQEINLGNSEERPTYWLLIDRLDNRAYISPVRAAIEKVKAQRLKEEQRPQQAMTEEEQPYNALSRPTGLPLKSYHGFSDREDAEWAQSR